MPAAAVIPALRMHRTIAAVKKLVVGFGRGPWTSPRRCSGCPVLHAGWSRGADASRLRATGEFTLNKSECSRQAPRLNARAWNNRRGSRSDFVGFAAEVMINRGGRGHSYFCVRGEIFGPQEDARQRRQLPSTSPLIKNESQRFEGD